MFLSVSVRILQKAVRVWIASVTQITLIAIPCGVASGTIPTPALGSFHWVMSIFRTLDEFGPVGLLRYFLELYDPMNCLASSTLNSFKAINR